ncbi:restriction endonuclease subunit S (plasmid) [Chryseobacterium panacisoli]|uniref:Restriction endonuclease subunit S n=1 Tax=Chryseobacterium panacisoli TaxID=1807141 RepID=A0A5D8ZXU8_9FLAO|nr:restriction endonuclease subunit S [Chryseobacterium panacisoli]TZF99401.1 restriction endonuclease subunit S [Chryseobacterium panacisoli]
MNKTKNKLVPELRFPEFKDDAEWEEKSIGMICKITNGKSNAQDHIDNGKYPLFDRSEVIKESNNFIFDCEAVIIPGEGMRFIPKYYKGKFDLHQRAYALKDFSSNGLFIYYLMLNNSNLLSQKAVQSTVLSLRLPILQEFPIQIPQKKQEQKKIADFLSSLDEILTLHKDKLDALKNHKKGLLQNLFPKEGRKIPELRFKEFKNDWQEIKLGQVCTYFKGFAFQSKEYTSNGRRIVRVSDMGFDYIKDETNAIYIDENKVELYKRWELKKNDLIITTVGSKPPVYDSLVGRTIVVKSKDENSLLNQNSVCLRANELIEQKFLNSLFKRNIYIAFIESIIRGNANQGSIALVDLFEYKFFLPELKEQEKIAECLSAVDNLITSQTNKIEQLKDHKKGLMQRLFPKIV